MTKIKPVALDFPDMPEPLLYVWRWFVRIANSGEVNLLTIEAFSRLMKINMTPQEIELILDFELASKKVSAEQIKKAK